MKRILVAILLLMLATPAWGQDFEKGVQAYERGDYATAYREWKPIAEQGDSQIPIAGGTTASIPARGFLL